MKETKESLLKKFDDRIILKHKKSGDHLKVHRVDALEILKQGEYDVVSPNDSIYRERANLIEAIKKVVSEGKNNKNDKSEKEENKTEDSIPETINVVDEKKDYEKGIEETKEEFLTNSQSGV